MIRFVTASAAMLIISAGGTMAAHADGEKLQEGRSIGQGCSPSAFVCAVLKDGSMKPTNECAARQEKAIRVLPGDCYDAD